MSDIVLREIIDSDIPIFFEHQADPLANEMAAFPAREWDAFVAHWSRIRATGIGLNRTILYRGQVAGNIAGFTMEGHREVGYWLGREFWGKGIASEALTQFLVHEKTRPLYGYVVKHNIASRRVLEKCGFSMIGEEDNHYILVLQ